MPGAPSPFDWRSLITDTAVPMAARALGNAITPDPETRNAKVNQQNAQFNQQVTRERMANAGVARQAAMPGIYTNLGYSPTESRAMAARPVALPPAGNPGGGGGGGLGSSIGKTALGVGLSTAPGIIGGMIKKGTAAGAAGTATTSAGGLGATMIGLATNPITLAAAGALAAGLIWKKSQAHPVADQWVQTEQNPFDQHWKEISDSNLPPEQKQAAMAQSAKNYLTELVQFAGQGGKNMTVARQAAAGFRKWYGDPAKYGVQVPF